MQALCMVLTRAPPTGSRPPSLAYKSWRGGLNGITTTTASQPVQPNVSAPTGKKSTMMRGAGGVLAVTVAALLVCCNADPHQESEVSGSEHSAGDRYDGHKPRNLDPLGGGNLVREIRESRHYGFVPYLMSRRYDYNSPYGGGAKREPWLASAQYPGYYGDGLPKRNFDEIDRSGLDNFVKKRNFDEIDQTSMPFPYAIKRFYHLYGPNLVDSDSPVSSFDKKRYRPDYPMDEIDLSHFPIGSKRSQDTFRPLR